MNPDGTLFAVLGDHEDGLVVDPKCGKVSACACFPQVLKRFMFLVNTNQVTFSALL